jgi:hypothetical protein
MADADAGDSAGTVRFDDIVARVVADPAQTQGVTLLAGFVGKGDAEGRVRIYPDLTFSSWHDVAGADVVHSIPLPKESSPLGGSYVWVKGGAEVKSGPAAQPQPAVAPGARAAAAAVPFSVQQTCGIACTAAPPLCPPPPTVSNFSCAVDCTQWPGCTQSCTLASTTCPQTQNQTCPPPCTVPSTLCPTVDVQTCPPQCQPTMIGTTCPSGDCTFFGTCPANCPQHAGAAAFAAIAPTANGTTCPRFICTETIVPTRWGTTCPRTICTETIPPTRHVTCPPHICTETMTPAQGGFFTVHFCAAGAVQPTPTATFFHTCLNCGPVAHPTPTATFNPTQCTQCFICPPITAPQTRTGVFNPFG